MSRLRLEGDIQTVRALRELGSRGARKATRNALGPAGRVVTKALKSATPRDLTEFGIANADVVKKSMGRLRRAKTYSSRSSSAGASSVQAIGPRMNGFPDIGKMNRGSDVTVGDGVEVWRKLHRVEVGGWSVPPRPFIKPAGEKARPDALSAFRKRLTEEIEKEAARQRKRANARALR